MTLNKADQMQKVKAVGLLTISFNEKHQEQ